MDDSKLILQVLNTLKTDMDRRFDELKTDMDRRFDDVKTDMDRRFDELKVDLGGKIDATNQRIDSTNQRIDSTNQRVDDVKIELGGKIDATNQRIDDLKEELRDVKHDLRLDSRKLEQVYESRDKVKISFGWQWGMVSVFIAVMAAGIVKVFAI